MGRGKFLKGRRHVTWLDESDAGFIYKRYIRCRLYQSYEKRKLIYPVVSLRLGDNICTRLGLSGNWIPIKMATKSQKGISLFLTFNQIRYGFSMST